MDGPGVAVTKAHTAVLLGEKAVGKTTFLTTITNSRKSISPAFWLTFFLIKDPDQLLVLTEKVLNNSITFCLYDGGAE